MTEQRYLEAEMTWPEHPMPDDTVFIPLTDEQDDAPATLIDPIVGYEGNWFRQSDRHERPARYLRLS